jgi:hypothetical protein
MNDQIKLLVAGAMTTLVGVATGGLVATWAITKAGSSTKPESREMRVGSKTLLPSAQIPPTLTSPSQFTVTPTRSPKNSNIVIRPTPSANYLPSASFQKVQNLPEVKQAREAAAEAQKRYFDAMKKAMGQTETSGQRPEVSGQKSEDSGAKTESGGSSAESRKSEDRGQKTVASGPAKP